MIVNYVAEQTRSTYHWQFGNRSGSLTVSPAMAEFLRSRAASVRRRVDAELLPIWLRQRGLEEDAS